MSTKVAILAGPPGAGKTTVARKVCERILLEEGGPVLHIEVDDLRHMVVGGEPELGGELWLKLLDGILEKAISECRVIVIEGLFVFSHQWNCIRRQFPQAKLLRLQASLTICLGRNRNRTFVDEVLPDEEVERLHGMPVSGPWHVINADQGLDAMTDLVYEQVINASP